jgi:hypothetical protein
MDLDKVVSTVKDLSLAAAERTLWSILKEVYVDQPPYVGPDGEVHHRWPLAQNGSNDSCNLVKVSYSDHLTVHLVYALLCPKNGEFAFTAEMMTARLSKLDNESSIDRLYRLLGDTAAKSAFANMKEQARIYTTTRMQGNR